MDYGLRLLPALVLLVAANATPVVAALLLRGRFAAPLDRSLTAFAMHPNSSAASSTDPLGITP